MTGPTLADFRRRAAGLHVGGLRPDYCDEGCPKCGWRDIQVAYSAWPSEQLRLFCRRCHYAWSKVTLDNAEKGGR